jgi:Protein of unknown function (DUF3175)
MAEKSPERWSQEVTEHSDALSLEKGVFTLKDPKEIAVSLKHSAEASERRRSDPYRSAMSMLNFYINRAGKNLSVADQSRLEKSQAGAAQTLPPKGRQAGALALAVRRAEDVSLWRHHQLRFCCRAMLPRHPWMSDVVNRQNSNSFKRRQAPGRARSHAEAPDASRYVRRSRRIPAA